jgi:hypothetical protein
MASGGGEGKALEKMDEEVTIDLDFSRIIEAVEKLGSR